MVLGEPIEVLRRLVESLLDFVRRRALVALARRAVRPARLSSGVVRPAPLAERRIRRAQARREIARRELRVDPIVRALGSRDACQVRVHDLAEVAPERP